MGLAAYARCYWLMQFIPFIRLIRAFLAFLLFLLICFSVCQSICSILSLPVCLSVSVSLSLSLPLYFSPPPFLCIHELNHIMKHFAIQHTQDNKHISSELHKHKTETNNKFIKMEMKMSRDRQEKIQKVLVNNVYDQYIYKGLGIKKTPVTHRLITQGPINLST